MRIDVLNGDIGAAYKRLKAKMSRDGLLTQVKQRHDGFLSRSERRRVKDAISNRRKQKHHKIKTWRQTEKKRRGKH